MFTGLIEGVGLVRAVQKQAQGARIKVEVPFMKELTLGESVAVNGCCLTVAAMSGENEVAFDLLEQTREVTTFDLLQPKQLVNLERALAVGSRLGGHLVQGHVDDVGEIQGLESRGAEHWLSIKIPPAQMKYCLLKGSITIDGISLTIAQLTEDSVSCSIIPHTFAQTNLRERSIGETVNLEFDVMAKYVERLLPETNKEKAE